MTRISLSSNIYNQRNGLVLRKEKMFKENVSANFSAFLKIEKLKMRIFLQILSVLWMIHIYIHLLEIQL